MGKRFASVLDMIDASDASEEFRESLRATIESRKLTKQMSAMRNAAGMTQEEMAKQMGCSQGTVSKIENSEDVSLGLADIMGYCPGAHPTHCLF